MRSVLFALSFWTALLVTTGASISASSGPLVVTVLKTYPPLTQVDINGQPAGMFVDIWNLWAKKTGRQVTFQATDWVGTLEALKSGEADIHAGLFFSEKRAEWMDYSQAFYSNQSSFYHRINDKPPPSDSTLEGVKIGVIKGYLQETFLREAYAKAEILTFANDRELIKALASGAIELFLSEDPTIEALLAETGMMGQIGSIGSAIQTNDLYASVLNGRTDLLKTINVGFQSITSSEWAEIEARWIKDPSKRVFGRDKTKGIKLSEQERKWISENPIISTIALEDWPPLDFKGDDGAHTGIAADILMLAANRAGLKVEPQFGPWADMLTKLHDGEIDLAPEIYYTEERAKFLAYSRPFLPLYNAIFVGSNVKGIKGILGLVGRNVAVEKGYAMEGMLKSDYPGINLVLVNSTLDALRKISTGEVDAYIGSQYVASYLIDQNLLHGIKPVAHFGEKPQFLHMAVPKDRTILRDIMDKALGSISEAEKRKIIGRYVAPTTSMLAASDTPGSVDLTDEEKSWLKKRPVIRIANETDWPPFDYVENGKPVGFSIDIIRKAANLVGLDVEFVNGFVWSELVNKFQDGSIDVLPAVYFTPKRNKTMDFTNGYAVNPPALAFKKDRTELNSLEDLKGLKLAVLSDTSFDHLLKERYPDIIRIPIDGAVQGMEAVAFGKADGFIESLSVASAIMEKNLISNIRLVRADGLQKKGENDLRMAVKKEDTILRDILQKGLNAIGSKEKSALFETHFAASRKLYEIQDQISKKVILTNAEDKWLTDHPIIRMAVTRFIQPLDIVDADGNYSGMNADLINLLNRKLGTNIVPEFYDTWGNLVDDVMSGEVDAALSLSRTSERERHVLFTKPYAYDPIIVATHQNNDSFKSWDDIQNKRIVAVEGMAVLNDINEVLGKGNLVLAEDEASALKMLQDKKVDAFVGFLLPYGNAQRSSPIPELKIAVTRNTEGGSLRIGVPKDRSLLFDILRKGLRVISRQELRDLRNTWLYPKNAGNDKTAMAIALTVEERQWIKEHPIVKVAPDPDYAPIEFFDKQGNYQGLASDFMKLVSERVGFKLEAVKKENWTAVIDALRNGEVDFIAANAATKEFLKEFIYSDTYSKFFDVIISNESVKGQINLEDLNGKKVLVAEGWPEVHFLRENYPEIEVIEIGTTKEALAKIAFKEYDYAYLYGPTAAHYIQEEGLPGLRVAGIGNIPIADAAMFRKDSAVLRSIISKGLATITNDEKREIRNRWVPLAGPQNQHITSRISLTDQEYSFIASHPELKFGIDTAWPPFEFIDEDGNYSGISSGIVDWVSKISGINMKPHTALKWSDVLKGVKKGTIEMVAMIQPTPERLKFMDFTEPYISFPNVILTRNDAPFISGLDGLAGVRTGVVKDYAVEENLEKGYSKINLIPEQNAENVLQALDDGKTDAAVVNLAVATYIIDKLNLTNLKIAAPTEFQVDLAMGVSKGKTTLRDILQKSLNAISEDEMTAIKNRWVAVRVNFGLDMKTILMWALPIAGGAVLIIAVILIWNRKMGNEISQRKEAQAELGQAMKHIEASINYASHIQRSILPDEIVFDTLFKEHFIIWEPRDVVGGDIYWAGQWGEGTLLCVGDCTGHGVPGAFMTLITTGAMDKALVEIEEGNVGEFLTQVHQTVQTNLGQDKKEGASDDGMELGVCYFPPQKDRMVFTSARFDLFIVENEKVLSIKPTKKGIGYRGIDFNQVYEQHEIELNENQRFYMTSDGLIDQIGGEKRRAYGKRRFKKLLLDIQHEQMLEQKRIIQTAFLEHKGDESRRDDLVVFSFGV